jgi:hypothetical protein
MPYIQKEFRPSAATEPVGPGELDYKLTLVILDYLARTGHNFTTMNSIIGVLENVKHEFQCRVLDPYEDKKCKDNGDVFPLPPVPR